MGVTLASFQEVGKYPSERERLKMTAYGCAKMCEPSFNRRGLIRSGHYLRGYIFQKFLLARNFSCTNKNVSHWYPGSGVVLDCIDS